MCFPAQKPGKVKSQARTVSLSCLSVLAKISIEVRAYISRDKGTEVTRDKESLIERVEGNGAFRRDRFRYES